MCCRNRNHNCGCNNWNNNCGCNWNTCGCSNPFVICHMCGGFSQVALDVDNSNFMF